MNKTRLIRNAALALALTGLTAGHLLAGIPDQGAELQAALEKADAARKKAASVDGEWRDTAKIFKKAQAAGQKGDYAKALKLANDAYRQGELGYQQALSQKNAGFPSYMH